MTSIKYKIRGQIEIVLSIRRNVEKAIRVVWEINLVQMWNKGR